MALTIVVSIIALFILVPQIISTNTQHQISLTVSDKIEFESYNRYGIRDHLLVKGTNGETIEIAQGTLFGDYGYNDRQALYDSLQKGQRYTLQCYGFSNPNPTPAPVGGEGSPIAVGGAASYSQCYKIIG